jgi:hypothetical protein
LINLARYTALTDPPAAYAFFQKAAEISDVNSEITGDDILEIAEIYRELGEFDMVKGILDEHFGDGKEVLKKIIFEMIAESNAASVRFSY